MAALVIFHIQDAKGAPLGDVRAVSTGGGGPWESKTNACGDVIDPATKAAGVLLTPGTYSITFSKPGYQTLVLPARLQDCGIITQALELAAAVLPPRPTRAQVCALQTSLAGLTYLTAEYGPIPAWFYGALDAADRAGARDAHRGAGDSHIPFPITEAYREGGTLWPAALANGYDYTADQDLDHYRAIALETIAAGFFIDCPLGGDGLGAGPEYNDPVGRTYGHEWLMANLERLIRALQGDGTDARPDLTPWIIFRPGWDAVFYSWGDPAAARTPGGLRWRWARLRDAHPTPLTPRQLDEQQQRVKAFGELFRRILPAGYLAIEHTPGNIPCGEGGGDYAPGGLMTTYDTILGEYNTFHEDSYWQIAGRMLSPYHRPADQPAGDDPNPPYYLGPGTPRGPYFYVVFEPTKNGVYEWCRGRCTREAMQAEDRYIRASGATLTGYPVTW